MKSKTFLSITSWILSLQFCLSLSLQAAPPPKPNDSKTSATIHIDHEAQNSASAPFRKSLFLKDHPGQNIELELYQGTPPQAIIDEVNNTPNAEFIEISAEPNQTKAAPNIEVYTSKENFPKNWWINHRTGVETTWCVVRWAVATGAFYLGLISFSNFSYPTILAGAQLAGLMSLAYMYKNIQMNTWLTKYKSWPLRIVRYYFLAVLYIGVVKFGIMDAEMVFRGTEFVDIAYLTRELKSIGYTAFVGTATQGFWGLWNAQYQQNKLKAIDKNLDEDLIKYQTEVVEMKSNFISFFNSIVNNTLSAVIATGGDMLIVDIITYTISASGIIAFARSYPRDVKCSSLF
jgi:hypothetical protein